MVRKAGNKMASLVMFFCMAMSGRALADPIVVHFSPSSQLVAPGQTFGVSLLADIPDPIIGWGVTLSFDPAVISLVGFTIGSQWFAAGSSLGGLAFSAPVGGPDNGLADLTFIALAPGSTALRAYVDPTNLTQGFALPDGSFAEVSFADAAVTVVPEPRAVTLFVFGLGLLWFRRRPFGARAL